jgi:DNA-binding transcriptional ArsR family regulator
MTGPEILRVLVAKRREIVAELDHHRRGANQRARDLEHVDATVRLFLGEPSKALVSALWMAGKPLSTDELAAHVGIPPKQAGAVLRYLADCGLVRGERAHGQATTWHPVY